MKEYKTTGFNYIRHIDVFQTITCICRHENTHPYKLGAIGIKRVKPNSNGTSYWNNSGWLTWLLKATGGNGLESSYEMPLEVEKYQCIEMETVKRNTMSLLPLLFLQRGVFGRAQKGSYVFTPGQSILQPGVGRPAGMWKAQPLELGMEPRELAAPAFPSPGACKVFVLLLSPIHSFRMKPIGSQWG